MNLQRSEILTSSHRRPGLFGRVSPPDREWLSRASKEDPIEPDLPIIDTHMHFWHRPNSYRYFVEDYARDATESGHNIEATMFAECHAMYRALGPDHLKCVGETEFAVGMSAIGASGRYTRTRVAAGIVGYADLTLGRLTQETLEAHIEAGNGRFKGVRHAGKWDADPAVRNDEGATGPGLYLSPQFGEGLETLTRLGLSLDASVFAPQIPDLTALARAHSDANIILIHTGSPVGHSSYAGRDKEHHILWLTHMKELARCPNVSIKIGGLLVHLGNYDYFGADAPATSEQLAQYWRPYIEPCLELFGADRCLVESNFPVDKSGFSYGTLWNMFKRITAKCSADEKRLIFSGTARRVYRLGDRRPDSELPIHLGREH